MAGEVQRGPERGRRVPDSPGGSETRRRRDEVSRTRCRGRGVRDAANESPRGTPVGCTRGVEWTRTFAGFRSGAAERPAAGMKGVPGERKTGWSGPLAKCVRNEFVRGGGWGRVWVWVWGVIPMPGSGWTTWPQVQAELQVVLKDV